MSAQDLLATATDRPADLLAASMAREVARGHDAPIPLDTLTPIFEPWSFGQCIARGVCLASLKESDASVLVVRRPWSLLTWNWAMAKLHACQKANSRLARLDVDAGAFSRWLESHEAGTTLRASAQAQPTPSLDPLRSAVEELSIASVDAQHDPIIRFLSATLLEALRTGASDAHLESDAKGLQVKLRLDGVLAPMHRLDSAQWAAQVISRLKVLCALDIAEHRVPQDGRMSVRYKGRAIDVRVSIMPSVHGEDAVLRVLDRQHLSERLQGLTLDKLGFSAAIVQPFMAACQRPHGMVLVTGPTGSGKTTTLYAALTQARNPEEKVITIEDPVEYQLPEVLQIPVNEKKGLTFGVGLRSILRHDPDRILVGEIRDTDTARIAVQAALTGHVVYTTIHANGAFEVLHRLRQLDVDPYECASALNAVLGQRLIRTLCPHCRTRDAQGFGVAVGCPACRNTGYLGRVAIGELLVLTAPLQEALARHASLGEVEHFAVAQGFERLAAHAQRMVQAGLTSTAERDRVCPGQVNP
jgi:general secretion pathway protein E